MKKILVLFIAFSLISCATIEKVDRWIKTEEKTAEGLYKVYKGIGAIQAEFNPSGFPKGFIIFWKEQSPNVPFEDLLLYEKHWFVYSLNERVNEYLSRMKGFYEISINATYQEKIIVEIESGQSKEVPVMIVKTINAQKIE